MSGVHVPARAQRWRPHLLAVLRSTWARLVVTIALLAVVATQIEWSAMGDRISVGHPAWGAAAVGLIVVALAVGAVRWRILLGVAGVHLSVAQVARIYAISTFSSTFLPTSVGGDVARAFLVARRGRLLARAGITVVLDRAAAFAGLIAVAFLAWGADASGVPDGQAHSLMVVFAICVAGTLAVGAIMVRPPGTIARRIPERVRLGLAEVRTIVVASVRRPTVGTSVLLSSVAFQALVVLQTCAIARAFDIDVSFTAAAFAVTLVTLATLVPVSIGGFGIREGSYIVLLGASGVSATDATLISLASVAVLFVASLPGAFLLIRTGTTPALESA